MVRDRGSPYELRFDRAEIVPSDEKGPSPVPYRDFRRSRIILTVGVDSFDARSSLESENRDSISLYEAGDGERVLARRIVRLNRIPFEL